MLCPSPQPSPQRREGIAFGYFFILIRHLFIILTSVSFFTIFFLKKHLDYKELAEKGVCDETSDAFPVDAGTPLSYNP